MVIFTYKDYIKQKEYDKALLTGLKKEEIDKIKQES